MRYLSTPLYRSFRAGVRPLQPRSLHRRQLPKGVLFTFGGRCVGSFPYVLDQEVLQVFSEKPIIGVWQNRREGMLHELAVVDNANVQLQIEVTERIRVVEAAEAARVK